jgi:hypothetical protein
MISTLNMLIVVAAGWILSGSILPALSLLIAWCFLAGWYRFRNRFSRSATALLALLVVVFQMSMFQWGAVGVDSPALFYHVSFASFIWIFFEGLSGRVHGAKLFWTGLVGAACFFMTLVTGEAFHSVTWLPLLLSGIPLGLILVHEYFRTSPGSPWGVGLTLFAFALSGFAADRTDRLLKASGEEEAVYQLVPGGDDGGSTTVVSDVSGRRGRVKLPRRANIKADNKARFYLSVDTRRDLASLNRRPLYLRTSTVAFFKNEEEILPLRTRRWILDGDDGESDSVTTLPEAPGEGELEYSIVLPREDVGMIPILDRTDRLRVSAVFEEAASRYRLELNHEAPWTRFVGIGSRSTPEENWMPRDSRAGMSPFLEMPDSALSRRIRSLTGSWQGRGNPLDSVREYLERNCRYSLVYENPRDLSPLDNFLFDERQGHCELYAASTVLMLRSLGVPSRIAYGYTGGTVSRRDLAIAFLGSDIHAWAEVIDRNGNWQIFDTTPPDPGSSRRALNRVTSPINWRMAAYDPESPFIIEDESATGRFGFFETLRQDLIPAVILVSLVVMASAAWLQSLLSGRGNSTGERSVSRVGQTERKDPLVRAIDTMGAAHGWKRRPGTTLRDFIGEMSRGGLDCPEAGEAVEYLYRVRYAGGEREPSREKVLLRAIGKYRLPPG